MVVIHPKYIQDEKREWDLSQPAGNFLRGCCNGQIYLAEAHGNEAPPGNSRDRPY